MLKKITLILLFAVVIVSCFSILFISAQSNFATNISGWRAVHGEWTETENGYNGSSGYPSLAISDQLVSSSAAFTYSGDVTHGDGGLSIIKSKENPDNNTIWQFNVAGGNLSVYKYYNDGVTGAETLATAAVAESEKYTIEITCDGAGGFAVRVNEASATFTDTSINGYLGVRIWDQSLTFNNLNYTSDTEFTTNLEGLTGVSGDWTLYKQGWVQQSERGRSFLASNKQVDTTKSFTYEVIVKDRGNHAVGLAFGTDADHYAAVQITGSGNVELPGRTAADAFAWWNEARGTIEADIQPTEYTILMKYDAKTKIIEISVNGTDIIETEIDPSKLTGYVGLYTEDSTATFTKAIYTEIEPPIEPDFETNLEGWEAASGTWSAVEDGYASQGNGRSFFKSNKQVDTTKSFKYEVVLKEFTGYGIGIAFGTDGDNFAGLEFNSDGFFSVPMRQSGKYAQLIAGDWVLSDEQKSAAEYTFVFEYNAASKTVKASLNGVVMAESEIAPSLLKGYVGLFAEDGQAVYTKAVFTETQISVNNPTSGDINTAIPVVMAAAALAVLKFNKRRKESV